MADASSALGAPEVAGAWVNPTGKAKRTVDAAGFGQYGATAERSAETPSFGGFGYLAVSATEVVLVKGKQGLIGLKLTDDVVAKVPRNEVTSVQMGEGKISAPLTVAFGDRGQWDLEVARAHRGAAQRVIAELGG